jgi:serine protease inhibitor
MFDINLQIDRPFIFIIRDKVSGQILFIGRVLNPTQ